MENRDALREVSFLGQTYEIDLATMDLSQLMGGRDFTIPCRISRNGYSIALKALVDTGANGLLFINTPCAMEAIRFFNTTVVPLKKQCPVLGFDGKAGRPITQVIILHFQVDGRRQLNVPMLIANLGQHDLIVGRKWLEKHDIWLDSANRCLIWPDKRDESATAAAQLELTVTRSMLKPIPENPEHQKDAARRDRAIAANMKKDPIRILQRPRNRTEGDKRRRDRKPTISRTKTTESVVMAPVRIAAINATAFRRNAANKENEVFVTSLYDIDKMLEQKASKAPRPQEDNDNAALVAQLLPDQYMDLKDVFSKTRSDELPPHRPIDHKIELEEQANLRFGPLYKQSEEELQATKKFLTENLTKGFIVPSQAPFAAPVLFIRKKDGSLRFCVDFCKLNAITKKDQYPLPLIDETLERLREAKIFTKLDIRQAFNRVRMHPESEDFTTFRTRYGSYKSKVLPFGLTNGPATFQRYINDVLFDCLDQFATAYVDNILIFSKSKAEHELHVRQVLERLDKADCRWIYENASFIPVGPNS